MSGAVEGPGWGLLGLSVLTELDGPGSGHAEVFVAGGWMSTGEGPGVSGVFSDS